MLLLDLALNAVATGLMLGSIYALLALGLAITFGILHVPNIAHPALMVVGAYALALANAHGLDPIAASVPVAAAFYAAGLAFYEVYYRLFERRGGTDTLQSLTLFFGLALVIEVALLMGFGADPKSVDVPYVGQSWTVGLVTLPYRLLVPALLSPAVMLLLWLYLKLSRAGLAIRAVASGETPLAIVGIAPRRVKRHAFGLATASAAFGGAALVILGPVGPFSGHAQIGRVFAVVVLAGMGSIPGTLAAGLAIGVAESLVSSFLDPSWSQGVAFAILLATLAARPTGLFGVPR
ncbi:MAG TPA: branched-chain amino acid ABC transporter permease [Beijerinckiaceae bacterium]|jgi:branched-chain amino acid transport system permease protein